MRLTAETTNGEPSSTVLFVDALDGPVTWAQVAREMEGKSVTGRSGSYAITFFVPNPLPTIRPWVVLGDALVKLEAEISSSASLDLVVAAGISAGPAAHLVLQGRARRAVLVNPDLAPVLTAIPSISVHVPFDEEAAMQTLEHLKGHEEEIDRGEFSDEVIDILHGALSGDPTKRRIAAIAKATYRSRQPLDRTLVDATGRGEASADWLTCWRDSSSIELWLTRSGSQLAPPLQEFSPGSKLTVWNWPEVPWLTTPGLVADALVGSFQ